MSTTRSHAVDSQNESVVPNAVQRNAPEGLERTLPDSVHNTDPNKDERSVSHATGPSIVPEAIQKAAPEGLERALPESIHPTKQAFTAASLDQKVITKILVRPTIEVDASDVSIEGEYGYGSTFKSNINTNHNQCTGAHIFTPPKSNDGTVTRLISHYDNGTVVIQVVPQFSLENYAE